MATVRILFQDADPVNNTVRERRFVVEADETESFAEVARRTIGDVPALNILSITLNGPGGMLALRVSGLATMGEVARFAGDEELPLNAAAFGGQWVIDLWTFIQEGLGLYGLLEVIQKASRAGSIVHFRTHRQAIKEWVLSGIESPPNDELVRLMKAERMWPHRVVEENLGLSRVEAAHLFAHLGYSYGADWDSWFEDGAD